MTEGVVREWCREFENWQSNIHENARLHRAAVLNSFWDVNEHPAYIPDLVPSDCHLFSDLKDCLRDQSFQTKKNIQTISYYWQQRSSTQG